MEIPGANIPGAMAEEALTWLYRHAKGMNSILEIGSRYGRSTTALLTGCHECNGKVTCVDLWEEKLHPTAYAQFIKNMDPFRARINIYRGRSHDLAEVLYGHWDMIFIDGSHEYPDVKLDLNDYVERADILICGHDYTPAHPGVVKAVDEYFGGQLNLEFGPNNIWFKYKENYDESSCNFFGV